MKALSKINDETLLIILVCFPMLLGGALNNIMIYLLSFVGGALFVIYITRKYY